MPLADPTNPILDEDPHRTGRRLVRKSAKREARVLARARRATAEIGDLPDAGHELVLIMDGGYHGWDLVEAVIRLGGRPVDEMAIATLGFNNAQAERLARLLDDGVVRGVAMVVSEMFREKNKAEYARLESTLTSRGQRVAATRNHAKLICLALDDGRRFTIHGSLNLRRCHAFEQVVIAHDARLHAFFRAFIDGQLSPCPPTPNPSS